MNLGSKITHGTREAASFFVPKNSSLVSSAPKIVEKRVVALIPTYKPTKTTLRLVQDVLEYNPNIRVIVIDDSTPRDSAESMKVLTAIKSLSKKDSRLELLRTPTNRMKAAALNFAFARVLKSTPAPQVVVTLDDDVVITPDTISQLASALYSSPKLGVVCSKALVKNKNKNILTRLQSLEYNGFNITKIGDDGFLYGPLVMQGMLSAFRFAALKQVKNFATHGLIEDYEITVRIKKAGWNSGIAPSAVAYTHVPEDWGHLWRQRVRWSYGGLLVLKEHWKAFFAIFQDIIGHILFMSLFILIIFSFVFEKTYDSPAILIDALLVIGIFHFAFSFAFGLVSLFLMPHSDRKDWVLRATIFPEFVYSNVLSLILMGSYVFYMFHYMFEKAYQMVPRLYALHKRGDRVFKKFGYSLAWGTRA